jgi:hypothetical protein
VSGLRAGVRLGVRGIAAVAFAASSVHAGDELRNWFDDPFFQVSSALPHCPPPAGPFMTEAQRRVEAHHRAERGTSCWLAHQCDRPTDYAYDREIAAAVRSLLGADPAVANSTLWVTVQGRIVFVEGCMADAAAPARIEAAIRSLPHVRLAIALARTDPAARAPYRQRE